MSIVAISETVGSTGTAIGRSLATALGYEFADREIISKAAECFGEGVPELTHATEERPSLWERFTDTQRRYMAYVEAIILEIAARDNVVLVGRACTVILGHVPHALRVRISAPDGVRAERVEREQGLTHEAAQDTVRRSDRERGGRVKFLYHVDWDDALLYDVVLNTERLSVTRSARLLQEALQEERLQSTNAGRRVTIDLSLAAQAKAALLADAMTRSSTITATCTDGTVVLAGMVGNEAERNAAHDVVVRIAGAGGVQNDIIVRSALGGDDFSHGQFRHGEERSWGGYGGGWYERDAVRPPELTEPERRESETRRPGG